MELNIRWIPADIQGCAENVGIKMTHLESSNFLEKHKDRLEERMTELGFEVIEDFLLTENSK